MTPAPKPLDADRLARYRALVDCVGDEAHKDFLGHIDYLEAELKAAAQAREEERGRVSEDQLQLIIAADSVMMLARNLTQNQEDYETAKHIENIRCHYCKAFGLPMPPADLAPTETNDAE